MIRSWALFVICATCIPSWSQCNGPATVIYGDSYAIRINGDEVWTYADSWAVGPDAPYDYLTVYQNDFLNGSRLGLQLVSSASPGYSPMTSRVSSVSTYGFGDFSTEALHTTYDACTGISMPPYISGNVNGWTSADVWTYPPQVIGDSRLWIKNYGANYPTSTTWSAYTGGAPDIPVWYFTGPASQVIQSCDVCNDVTITLGANAVAQCSTAVTGYFMLGRLKSPEVGILIDDGVIATANNPQTGQRVDYQSSVPNPFTRPQPIWYGQGYQSNWYWQTKDLCGTSMPNAEMHESFPQGFQYDPGNATSNWGFPTANVWQAGSDGIWYDNVGYICLWPRTGSPSCNPMPLPTQQPLGTNLVYSGLLDFWIGNNADDAQDKCALCGLTQRHFQDHGDYAPQQ